MLLHNSVLNTYASLCVFTYQSHVWETTVFYLNGKAKGFILIAVICNHTEKPKGLDTQNHLEGTHGLAQTTPSWFQTSSFSPMA